MAAKQLSIVRIISVTEGPASKNGGTSKHIVAADGREWNDFDQGHWPAYQVGRTIGVELIRNGQWLNIERGPDAVDPNPGNLPPDTNGTYSGGQLAPGAGLSAKDLSIHRQVALKAAVDTLGLVGVLGGEDRIIAAGHVLELADAYRRWLDQEGF